MTTEQHTADRLTPADINTMRDRAAETIRGWAAASEIRRYRVRDADALALARVMWHAIGCSSADLRDAELDRIDRLAASYIGTTFNARGDVVR